LFFFLGVILFGAGFAAVFQGSALEKVFLSNVNFLNVFDDAKYLSSNKVLTADVSGVSIIEQSFLKPAGPPFLVKGKTLGVFADFSTKKEIEEYIVEQGDTIEGIAQKFEVSIETILWANELSKKSILKSGQKLIILPVSGVMHIVREGDTLGEISQLYNIKTDEILRYNDIGEDNKIYAGDFLIIPGASQPKVSQQYSQVPLSGSYFICPVPSPCRITQTLHWFNAIDFSNSRCGEPVFAAAGGQVQRVGYGNVSGYYVRILHPNGVITFYGHLSKSIVNLGQSVYQGQIIGYVGYSGVTIPKRPAGCHLHFDVRFARNPFSGYAVGTELGR